MMDLFHPPGVIPWFPHVCPSGTLSNEWQVDPSCCPH